MGTSLLQRALGVAGAASPGEIRSRYRSLAQRCAGGGQADPGEHERLRLASLALAQELSYLGHDEAGIGEALAGEGCPVEVAVSVAQAASGPVSRRVPAPLERETRPPADLAYARLAERTLAAEPPAGAAASGYGFIVRLAVAFVVVMGGLVAALDFFPRLTQPARVAPATAPYPVELLPPQPAKR